MYPLEWNFVNISYVLPSMLEFLESPFPYIAGVTRDVWNEILETRWELIEKDIVAFDIDKGRVYKKEELPKCPEPYTSFLITSLKKQLKKLESPQEEMD